MSCCHIDQKHLDHCVRLFPSCNNIRHTDTIGQMDEPVRLMAGKGARYRELNAVLYR